MSRKAKFIVALVIGGLISAVLIVLEPLTDYALLSWEMPGISVAYLFWGMVGGSVFAGLAIAWAVNALIYGVGAFVVLSVLSAMVTKLQRS